MLYLQTTMISYSKYIHIFAIALLLCSNAYGSDVQIHSPFKKSGTDVSLYTLTDSVGIGTASPSVKLEVVTSAMNGLSIGAEEPASPFDIDNYGVSIFSGSVRGQIRINASQMEIGATTNHPISFIVNDIEQVSISLNGSVGLNNNSTLQWRDSGGSLKNILHLDNSDIVFLDNPIANKKIAFRTGATPTTRMVIDDTTGAVGIGIDPPTSKLHVVGTVKAQDTSSQTTPFHGINLTGNTATSIEINDTDNTIRFRTNPDGAGWSTGDLVIDADNGNTGINTVSPSEKLEVTGNIKASGSYISGSSTGLSSTIVVKGSDGNNCNLVFTGGIITSTTCP